MKNANAYAIPIELDRPRRLRFDVNALAELEIVLGGRSIGSVFSDEESMGMATLRAFLWAGLRHEDRSITLERAGMIIQKAVENGISLAEMFVKVAEAINSCGIFKRDEEVQEAGENPPPATA